tara:strand:- start:286 stop:855 length:570 start_codon:yes stop_codon:yes gene_type:complete
MKKLLLLLLCVPLTGVGQSLIDLCEMSRGDKYFISKAIELGYIETEYNYPNKLIQYSNNQSIIKYYYSGGDFSKFWAAPRLKISNKKDYLILIDNKKSFEKNLKEEIIRNSSFSKILEYRRAFEMELPIDTDFHLYEYIYNKDIHNVKGKKIGGEYSCRILIGRIPFHEHNLSEAEAYDVIIFTEYIKD